MLRSGNHGAHRVFDCRHSRVVAEAAADMFLYRHRELHRPAQVSPSGAPDPLCHCSSPRSAARPVPDDRSSSLRPGRFDRMQPEGGCGQLKACGQLPGTSPAPGAGQRSEPAPPSGPSCWRILLNLRMMRSKIWAGMMRCSAAMVAAVLPAVRRSFAAPADLAGALRDARRHSSDDLWVPLGDQGVQQHARPDAMPVETLDGAPDPDPGAVVAPPVVERVGCQLARPDALERDWAWLATRREHLDRSLI